MSSDKKFTSETPVLSKEEGNGAILFSSSHERSEQLGKSMEAIGAKVRVISNMDEAKKIIADEDHGFLISDVSGFDPSGINMLNWFNGHIHKKRVRSLGIITSADTIIPKSTYQRQFDNTFTVGEITIDEIASVLLSLYSSNAPLKWLTAATEYYHEARKRLTTGEAEGKVVLLLGAPGVGRDAFAQIAHEMGERKDHKFVFADCRLRTGKKPAKIRTNKEIDSVERNLQALMAEAEGGTLYFHEAGLLPKDFQSVLAKVIKRNKYREPGDGKLHRFTGLTIVSVEGYSYGKLSKELSDVVSPITLRIPPLSKCKDDIIPLAEHFIAHFCMREGIESITMTGAAKDALLRHEWSGNIRELFAVVTRAAQESNKKRIEKTGLNMQDVSNEKDSDRPVTTKSKLMKALRDAKGKKAKAARIIGTSRQHVYRLMELFGIPQDYGKNPTEEIP